MDGLVEGLHEVAAATVTVTAEVHPSHPSVSVLGTERQGTGTVVDCTGGLVLTVNYIVLGAREATLTSIDGEAFVAQVVAHDFATGIALLQAERGKVAAQVSAGSSHSLKSGQDVFTIASAGLAERRSSWGIVTSVEPFDAYWEYLLDRAIWTSSPNPGLGGGPLCDCRGRLVGIVSLNLGAVGRATLAIPSENYFDHAEELLAHGRRTSRKLRAWLGMFCYSFPDRTIIAGLMSGGPGETCGLKVGDVIVRIDGEQVDGRAELYQRLWGHAPGEKVEFYVFRDGSLTTVEVTGGDVDVFFA